jgi:Sulfotransferase domain
MGILRFNPWGWWRPGKSIKLNKRSDRWYRLLSSPLRTLPDFIIIGVQKGGTTSLHHYLASSASVLSGVTKEVHYFDQNYPEGQGWYRANFSLSLSKRFLEVKNQRVYVTGEATPNYFFYPQVPGRIAELLPNVKLILLLRNPVDRALSQYYHNVRSQRETLTFEAALDAEPERLKGELEKLDADPRYHGIAYRTFSYASRGLYLEQLKHWLERFSRGQILIIKSEDLFERPTEVFNQTLAFLGLPPEPTQEFKSFNAGSYAPMSPATRQRLVEFFAPYNQELYEYLGMDFGWDA